MLFHFQSGMLFTCETQHPFVPSQSYMANSVSFIFGTSQFESGRVVYLSMPENLSHQVHLIPHRIPQWYQSLLCGDICKSPPTGACSHDKTCGGFTRNACSLQNFSTLPAKMFSAACEAQVQLIGVTRIPSRCVAVVTAEVSNLSGRQPVVFEPDDAWLEESRLQVEDSLLDPDEAGRVNLVIHNPTSETRRLEAGCSIGVAMPCLDSDQSGEAVAGMATSEASSIQVRHVQPECGATVQARKTKLGWMLDIGEGQLAPEEVAQVRSCVLQAHDVFAVEKGELGSVSEVQHRIKTEDCSPVRQPPRRVPFSLRPEISRMVNEMLQAQVIEESSSPWASPVVLVRKKDICYHITLTKGRVWMEIPMSINTSMC